MMKHDQERDEFDFSDQEEDRAEYEKRTGLKWEDREKGQDKEKNIPLFDRWKLFWTLSLVAALVIGVISWVGLVPILLIILILVVANKK